MNQTVIENIMRTHLDSIAEIGNIEEFDRCVGMIIQLAVSIRETDNNFNAKNFITACVRVTGGNNLDIAEFEECYDINLSNLNREIIASDNWLISNHHVDCLYPNTKIFHHCYHATGHCDECNRLGTRDHCPLKHLTDRHDYKKKEGE